MLEPFAALHLWIVELLSEPRSRAELEAVFRQVWDEEQLAVDYEVLGFKDETMEVRRKSDGAIGSLSYQDNPQFYFGFIADL